MTNDELEAVRARAEAATPGPWSNGHDDTSVWGATGGCPMIQDVDPCDGLFIAHARTDIPALLDEVERLRSRAAPDPCEAQVPFDTPDGVTWFPAPLGSADPFDRATRAEAHAERLAGALADVQNPACLMMCPDVWPDDTDQPHTIACTNARSALAAYRGVKDEACSRPSDALDAPVCASEVPPDA